MQKADHGKAQWPTGVMASHHFEGSIPNVSEESHPGKDSDSKSVGNFAYGHFRGYSALKMGKMMRTAV
jgi:hypothetical protein